MSGNSVRKTPWNSPTVCRLKAISDNPVKLRDDERKEWIEFAAEESKCDPSELSFKYISRPVFLAESCLLILLRYERSGEYSVRNELLSTAGAIRQSCTEAWMWVLAGERKKDRWIRPVWQWNTDKGENWPSPIWGDPRLPPFDQKYFDSAYQKIINSGSSVTPESLVRATRPRNPGNLKDLLEEYPEAFVLNKDTVKDYVRVFGDFAIGVSNPDASSDSRPPLLIESLSDVQFFTPLLPCEEQEIDECAKAFPISVRDNSRESGYIVVYALVLDAQRLRRVQFKVYTHEPKMPAHSKKEQITRGQIKVGEVDQNFSKDCEEREISTAYIDSLPLNYLRSIQERPTIIEERLGFKADFSDKIRLSPLESKCVIKDINCRLSPMIIVDEETTVFRRREWLASYGAEILAIHNCLRAGKRHSQLFLWKPGFVLEMSWLELDSDLEGLNDNLEQQPVGVALEAPVQRDDSIELEPMTVGEIESEVESGATASAGQKLEILNKFIVGRLNLSGENLGTVRLINCRFRSSVRLDHVNFAGNVDIRNCVFEEGLTLANAEVRGSISLADVVACGKTELSRHEKRIHPGTVPLSMYGMSARAVSLSRVCVDDTLLATHLQVKGSVLISAVQALRYLRFNSSNIGDELDIGLDGERFQHRTCAHFDLTLDHVRARSIRVQAARIGGTLRMVRVYADQCIDLQSRYLLGGSTKKLIVDEILLAGSIVAKNSLAIEGVDVKRNIFAKFVRVGTDLSIEADAMTSGMNEIGGDIDLTSATIPQLLRIRRTKVVGSLNAPSLQVGSVVIAGEPDFDEEGEEPIRVPCEIDGRVNLAGMRCAGESYVVGVVVKGDLLLRQARIGGDLTLSIDCKTAGGRGRILPGKVGPRSYEFFKEFWLSSDFLKGIDLTKSKVEGDVVLSSVECLDGIIDMDDAEVSRDIEIKADKRRRAYAKMLRLEGLRCEGSVDITGLELGQECEDDPNAGAAAQGEDSESGHVHASGAVVRGELKTSGAKIPGCLDLEDSELGALDIDVDTFPHLDTKYQDPVKEPVDVKACGGVILRRSTIGMLSIIKDPKDPESANRPEKAYPRPVDLSYSEIKWWEFDPKNEEDESQDYINLLEGYPAGKQRHIYQSIESTLYNWGHFDKADEIHREMRRWLLKERIKDAPRFVEALAELFRGRLRPMLKFFTSLPGIAWHAFWDGVTRGLTSPLRLVFVMLVWALFSIHVFSLRENIGLSEEGYLTKSDSIRYLIDRPPDEDWGLPEGVWMAFHFHVPVAQFTARDEWEPANDRPLVIGSGAEPARVDFLTSEGYANIVLVLHWIMWPVVIILSTRRLFRRAQQS